MENNELFDLGSSPASDDFDPFALEEETDAAAEETPVQQEEEFSAQPQEGTTTGQAGTESDARTPSGTAPKNASAPEKGMVKTADAESGLEEKPPVFVYAGATENIGDTSMTFDELRIEKSQDFPELDDGKRVSWTVEYGKITKTVTDAKGTSIGKMKTDIEASKEFTDNLKRAKDKNPVCKVKPRVTAQSKGTVAAYKGVFPTMEEAEASGKMISIVPSRDGRVYEVRKTEMGRFVTPVSGCEILSEVQAGFIPALPKIPAELVMQMLAFFRHFVRNGSENEALLNIYWDKEGRRFIADAPEQVVTKISVDSRISEKYACDRYIHYMDIHSHNTMDAFFSPVDDRDEKATRLYAVVGRLDRCIPEIKTRISNGGKFLEISPAEVFEYTGTYFPEEWKEHINRKPYHTKQPAKCFMWLQRRGKNLKRRCENEILSV